MKEIREVYPGYQEDVVTGDYGPLLASFGYETLLQVDDDDYQGDSRLLFRDGNRIGLLIFGWGSCSGCDALQACESYAEIEALRTQLLAAIVWFESARQALMHFQTHDWQGDYSYHGDETKRFIAEGTALLKTMATALHE